MALTISVINFKGGVSKTTTCINLAAALNELGQKVLVIDGDAQGNVSTLIGENFEADKRILTIASLYESVSGKNKNKVNPKDAIIKTKFFDYIPNNLYAYERTNGLSDYSMLDAILKKIKSLYDFIIVDTPPYLGLDATNAIFAADMLTIVTDFSKTSVEGVKILITVLENWHDKSLTNVFKLKPKTVLFTKYQKSTIIAKQLLNKVEQHSDMGLVLSQKIPLSNIVIADSYKGLPTVVSRPKSKVSLEYRALAQLFLTAKETGIISNEKYNLNLGL